MLGRPPASQHEDWTMQKILHEPLDVNGYLAYGWEDGLFLHVPLVFDSSPLKNDGWKLEDDPFLLGFGNFSGANC